MNYTIFKLSFILYLQKKYYPVFKLGKENVYVLPPVLKRSGLFFSLAFPVAKRFDKNTISRPVGVILVNKNVKEKCFDMIKYEFTNFSQDFEKKYTYKTFEQEYLKVTLNLLMSCYKKFSLFKTKEYNENYLSRLKNSFDDDYSSFYEDLESNRIVKISSEVINEREKKLRINSQKSQKTIKTDEKMQNFVNFELKNFIRREVWSTFRDKNAFLKLAFLDLLGETLKKNFNLTNSDELLKQKKFAVAKDYAKAVNILKNEDENVDFLSKLLIIFLNSLLIEEKEKKVKKLFENQIKDACALLNSELIKVEDKKIKEILSHFQSQLTNDYSTVDKKKFSNIFYAYLFLFLD